MFPGIYDFHWDPGHLIFLGVFYSVLVVVLITTAIAARRAVLDFRAHRVEQTRWHTDFEDLPRDVRPCRHALTGEAPGRVCERGFDCRHCVDHPRFDALRGTLPLDTDRAGGFEIAPDRLYHRGHTWVRPEPDGTLAIGLDDLGRRLLGVPDTISLPTHGTKLVANGPAFHAKRNGVDVRVLAPVDGQVVAHGGPQDDWLLRVQPADDEPDTRHLLDAAEARPWMVRESERLQVALAAEGLGASLADGGLPVEDLGSVIPRDRLDDVYGAMFLHP